MLNLSMICVIVNLTKFSRQLLHIMHSLCSKKLKIHPSFLYIVFFYNLSFSLTQATQFCWLCLLSIWRIFVSLHTHVYPEQIEYSLPHISVTVSTLENIPNLCNLFSQKLKNVTIQQRWFLPSCKRDCAKRWKISLKALKVKSDIYFM